MNNEIYENNFKSVVYVNSDIDDFSYIGSGFIIKQNKKYYVVCAAHSVVNFNVVNNDSYVVANKIYIGIRKCKEYIVYSGKLIGYDGRSDVAVLEIIESINDLSFFKWNKNIIKTGDTIFTIGFSIDSYNSFSKGTIRNNNYSILTARPESLLCALDVYNGDSGAPVFNKYGRLLGIITSCLKNVNNNQVADNLAIAVSYTILKRIVKYIIKNNSNYIKCNYGIGISTPTPEIYIKYNSIDNKMKGAVILSISNNGPAYNAGLVVGDIILYVDDVPIGVFEYQYSVSVIAYRKKPGDKVKITYSRNGNIYKTILIFSVTTLAQDLPSTPITTLLNEKIKNDIVFV